MKTALSAFAFVSLAALLFASGCGKSDGDEIETPKSSADNKGGDCRSACEEQSSCEDDLDVSECTQTCSEDETLSRGGQEVIADCLALHGCDASESELSECIEAGAADLPLGEAGEEFCAQTLNTIACSDGSVDDATIDECRGGVGLISDEFLSDFNACNNADSCEDAQLCFVLAVLPLVTQGEGGALGQLGSLEELGELLDILGEFDDQFGGGEGGPGTGTSTGMGTTTTGASTGMTSGSAGAAGN